MHQKAAHKLHICKIDNKNKLAQIRVNYLNNSITLTSQHKHGIKTTQLLSEANLSMASKQLNYFHKPTKVYLSKQLNYFQKPS
jgi:hypothetical protein